VWLEEKYATYTMVPGMLCIHVPVYLLGVYNIKLCYLVNVEGQRRKKRKENSDAKLSLGSLKTVLQPKIS
jgi:hypothetical protein